MDENNNYEQTENMEEQNPPISEMTDEALKEAISTQMKKYRWRLCSMARKQYVALYFSTSQSFRGNRARNQQMIIRG